MKSLALILATGALCSFSLGEATAEPRGDARHWRGGHGTGHHVGHGGRHAGHHHGSYWGSHYRGHPYASFYYSPFPVYVGARYYAYTAYPQPVYIERRVVEYVEVAPRPRARYEESAPPPVASAGRHDERRAAAPSRYTLSAQELFEFDRADLRKPQPRLDEIAAALKENPQVGAVTITGHTDRLGSEEYNQKLSERRAHAVKEYLVAKGVEPKRLDAVGRGETQPVVECGDKDTSALIKCLEPNRRVEVERITIEVRASQGRVAGDRSRAAPAPGTPAYR